MIPWVICSFFGFMLLGVPIAFTMGVTSLVILLKLQFLDGQMVPLRVIASQMFTGIDSFPFMAIPFFMIAGELMNAGGITSRLVRFSNGLVGRVRGGLAHVNVISSIFFAGITGAAVADTAAIGSILIPAMKREGYTPEFSAAITAASSCIGPIIPPSLIMVVYGVAANESIGALFVAGFLPGVTMGLFLMLTIVIMSRWIELPRKQSAMPFREILSSAREAFLSFLMPLIIIGGILSGVFTATEAAAVAVVYALIVGFFVFKELNLSRLPALFIRAGVTSATVLLIASCATIFKWLLATEQIPQNLAAIILSVNLSPIAMLFLINAFLIVVGCLMETSGAILILTPILLPLATQLGIHPLHFGIIMVLNLTIGLATPPVGVCLFVACSVGNVSFEKLTRAIWPFIISNMLVLILFTFFPAMALWLPRVAGYIK